jgi:hypothetical protein
MLQSTKITQFHHGQTQAMIDVFLDVTWSKAEDQSGDNALGGLHLPSSEAAPKGLILLQHRPSLQV